MIQVVAAVGLIVVALATAAVLRRRQAIDAPTQANFVIPQQVDRADFVHLIDTTTDGRPSHAESVGGKPDGTPHEWLVVVFTAATCSVCADMVNKAAVLATSQVAVVDVEYGAQRQLHAKYDIQAVPLVVVCDRDGVVRSGFAGPVSATDLWAAVAEAREPGVSPEPHLGVPPT